MRSGSSSPVSSRGKLYEELLTDAEQTLPTRIRSCAWPVPKMPDPAGSGKISPTGLPKSVQVAGDGETRLQRFVPEYLPQQ